MLRIVKYPNLILEQVSLPVELPLSNNNQDLIRNMFELVKDIGVGLAAPQVGQSKQLFIVHLSGDKNLSRESSNNPDFVVINPKITFYSNLESQMIEGCLSFPDQYYKIWRPSNILIEFYTIANTKKFLEGAEPILKKTKLKASKWLSRILQHEYDHLQGKVYIKMGGKKLSKKELDTENGQDIID